MYNSIKIETKNSKKINTFELFGGIGAPRKALRNQNLNFESLGFSEWYVDAICAYLAIHEEYEDISLSLTDKEIKEYFENQIKIDDDGEIHGKYSLDSKTLAKTMKNVSVKKLRMLYNAEKLFNNKGNIEDIKSLPKDLDILFHGSPCQDFSTAGKGAGGEEGAKTRSSLMWETVRLVEDSLPKTVIWENVKGSINKRNIETFNKYLDKMESLGYTNSYELLNSKDFNIPQNRNRVFVISTLNNESFDFSNLTKSNETDITQFIDFNKRNYSKKQIEELFGIKVPNKENFERKDFYLDETVEVPKSFTDFHKLQMTSAMKNYIVDSHSAKEGSKTFIVGKKKIINPSIVPTISTREGQVRIASSTYISKDFEIDEDINGINIEDKDVRKLSPCEAFLLMGFSKEDYQKAREVIEPSKIYKVAGNSIVVNVLEAIFKELV